MAKANQRFVNPNGLSTNVSTHAKEGEYAIPYKYRKEYQGNNKSKWVSKNEYNKFLKWLKTKKNSD